ncbi:MAG: PAS domain-containing protein [Actinomycetota bacterium]|nr:PAS domain-containing protein [Actinomycetota bacterium]
MTAPDPAIARVHEQLVALAGVTAAIVWVADAAGAVFHASDAFHEFVGRRDLDLAAGEWLTMLHPDDRSTALAAWVAALSDGSAYSTEFRLRRHDGRYRWHQLAGQPVHADDGTVAAWYGTAVEVDDSRREQHLVVAENRLLEAVAGGGSLPDVLADTATMLEGLVGGSWTVAPVDDDVAVVAATPFVRTVSDSRGRAAVVVRRTDAGPPIDTDDLVVVDRAVQLLAIALERDRVDTELRDAATTLRLATRLTRIGAWSVVLGDDTAVWSDEVCDIHGVPQGSAPLADDTVDYYVPEDRALVRRTFRECVIDGVSFDIEARITRPDGTEAWVRSAGEPQRGPDGRVIAVRGALQDISEWKAAQAAVRDTERRFSDIAKATSDVVWEFDVTTNTIWRSSGLPEVFGPGGEDSYEPLWADRVHPDDGDRVNGAIQEALTTRAANFSVECRIRRLDGGWSEVRLGAALSWDGERMVRMVGNVVDVSTERELERQRLQGQRLEAIGQLTGGVAHDFNNLLAVIMGGAEVLELELRDSPDTRDVAAMIRKASERGAELTRRLLAFARRQPLEPAALDVHALLAGLDVLLRRTLGTDLEVEYVRAGGLWPAMADAPQLEAAVLNLCLNGRDAMPAGGRLTIETANSHLDHEYAGSHPGVAPGQYVMIAVSDTGTGMTPEVAAQVFEPFFTTKRRGAGTGLGLSMVYGFVKQSAGHVKVYSEVGEGTTVRLYLPRSFEQPASSVAPAGEEMVGGDETILVVEDDGEVRDHVVRQLEHLGYAVRAAENADVALAALEADPAVHLLFTDVVMPGSINGRQLADVVAQRWPSIRVLFTSGYTENAIVHHGRLDPGVQLLVKPYRLKDLADRVRSVLDAQRDV